MYQNAANGVGNFMRQSIRIVDHCCRIRHNNFCSICIAVTHLMAKIWGKSFIKKEKNMDLLFLYTNIRMWTIKRWVNWHWQARNCQSFAMMLWLTSSITTRILGGWISVSEWLLLSYDWHNGHTLLKQTKSYTMFCIIRRCCFIATLVGSIK